MALKKGALSIFFFFFLFAEGQITAGDASTVLYNYRFSHQQLIRRVQLRAQVRPPGVEPGAQVREVLARERRPPQREELRAAQVRSGIQGSVMRHHCFKVHEVKSLRKI